MSEPDLTGKLGLYLVADPEQCSGPFEQRVRAALEGGVTAVQLRWKGVTDREYCARAEVIGDLCAEFDALFIINDRLDIAMASGADGVHLGVDDLPLFDAIEIAGDFLVIGYSPETDEQAAWAAELGVDYLGVGPVFGTASKSDAGPAIGLDAIHRRAALSTAPIIGIGGITAANARSVIDAGAAGVAVVGAILKKDDPKLAAERLAKAIRG